MNDLKFAAVAATESNENWEILTGRQKELYSRVDDVRNPFERDYTRVLHSMAYRRLKHKTQVFFNIDNDHVCTRMEHVSHVESVSTTIAKSLGLNTDLTRAISIGHDLGHAPFGHQGEDVIKKLTDKYLGYEFWHEKNGVRFVDKIELLADNYNIYKNLNLTYAVRDGILSHCGEVDLNGLKPRDISISVDDFTKAGQYEAVTWEGCIVKMADKIAYVGRDIEDAVSLGILNEAEKAELIKMARVFDQKALNTTVIMHNMIIDICSHSSPDAGITLSEEFANQLNEIKGFNYEHIYNNKRLAPYREYAKLVINQLFDLLKDAYDGKHTWSSLSGIRHFAPNLIDSFESWLAKYCDIDIVPVNTLGNVDLQRDALQCENEKIYGKLETEKIYLQAVIDYISGMTDRYAITMFNELLQYGYHG